MSREPMERPEAVIPPYLRGLTYDGVKGLCITRIDTPPAGEVLTIECGEEDQSQEQLLEDAGKQFHAYTHKHQSYPAAVRLSTGVVFGLGVDYQEASAAAGCSILPQVKGSTSRSDVVRNKIALVTGGAQGFGEGMVRGLAAEGAFVFIADMNLTGATALAETLNAEYGRTTALAVEVNVTDESSVEKMLYEVTQLTGGLDIFISNAGVLRAGSVKEMTLRDFNFVTSVDYVGFFICTKHTSRVMALQHQGSSDYRADIIAISSKSGLEGSNKNGAYSGAKFGTIGLTQSFALELVTDGIKVNAICPGNFLDGPLWSDPEKGLFVQYLQTGKVPGAETLGDVRRFYEAKVPLGRGCTTDDVMKALLYCVEQHYETGQAIPVTGGQVMLN